MAVEDLTYTDYWRIFQGRWKWSAAAALLGIAGGLGLAKLQSPEPIYEATATAGYEPQSGFEMATMIPAQQPRDMTTQILLIRGTEILGNAAKRLGRIPAATPQEKLDEHLPIIAELRNQSDAAIDRGFLAIRGRAPSPEDAARIANAVVQAYREENLFELKKYIIARREFLEKQLADNEKSLNEAQLRYEEYRREHLMAAIEPGIQGAISNVAQREARAQEVVGKIEEVRRQIGLVATGKPISDLALQTIVGGASTARLTQLSMTYTQLNIERSRLLTELTEVHPAVRQKLEQLESVRADIAAELHLILDAFQKQEQQATEKTEEMRQQEESLPQEAMQLAHLARQVKIHESLDLQLRQQLEDTLLKEAGVTGQVTIMTIARPPQDPINPPAYARLGVLGGIGGLFAGFVLAVFVESARFSRQNLRGMEESLDLPVLGISPRARTETLQAWLPVDQKARPNTLEWSRSLGLALLLAPRSPFSESFRTLRANLHRHLASGTTALTLSATHLSEGTTTTAINLALSFAQAGQRILLVEADLRNPSISSIFKLQTEPGLVDFVIGSCKLEEATRGVPDFVTGALSMDEILLAPGLDHLHVMPCGQITATAGEILASEAFSSALTTLRSRYDVVVFDSPALAVGADCLVLGKQTDIILVFSPQKSVRSDLEATVAQFRKADCKLLGLFVNGMDAEDLTAAAEPTAMKAAS